MPPIYGGKYNLQTLRWPTKKKIEDLELESEIKRRTMRKLDLEIKKLEREVSYAFSAHCMLTVTQIMY